MKAISEPSEKDDLQENLNDEDEPSNSQCFDSSREKMRVEE